MRVAVTGGGTGGHTLPVLAVIKSLTKKNAQNKFVFIGSRFGIESRLIPKMGIKYYGISCGKFRRYHKSKFLNLIDPTTFFKNFADFFRFIKGIFEAREILQHEEPDVLFAKGGYVSLPVGIAARMLHIPVVIHESDLVMGLANRRMAGFAEKVCLTFDKKLYPDVDPEKVVVTGNPVREDILMGDGDRLKAALGMDKKRKTILILGGSQGSLFLNEIFIEILDEVLESYQLIWIAGERDAEIINYEAQQLPEELKQRLKVYSFVTSEMADVYAAADLVVSRSGSNVLFELAALGKPAILVPHDVSPGSHQFENAQRFSRQGAAYLFKQDNINPKKMLHQLNYLLKNDKELSEMGAKMRSLSDLGAADKVAEVVYEVGVKKIEQAAKFKEE